MLGAGTPLKSYYYNTTVSYQETNSIMFGMLPLPIGARRRGGPTGRDAHTGGDKGGSTGTRNLGAGASTSNAQASNFQSSQTQKRPASTGARREATLKSKRPEEGAEDRGRNEDRERQFGQPNGKTAICPLCNDLHFFEARDLSSRLLAWHKVTDPDWKQCFINYGQPPP